MLATSWLPPEAVSGATKIWGVNLLPIAPIFLSVPCILVASLTRFWMSNLNVWE